MKGVKLYVIALLLFFMAFALAAAGVDAAVVSQCPAGVTVNTIDPAYMGETDDPNVVCAHLTGGDGWISMRDFPPRTPGDFYIFSFANVTGVPDNQVMSVGMEAAVFPAPTIEAWEGQEVYLTLSNVGMVHRPDLFDPHTVHWHGFPNASAVFDGVPDNSISINMGSSLTYYYNVVEPGTFMYHCHVEATEHMQMGMLGNLYVHPAQDGLPDATGLPGCTHNAGNTYAYNDGDCSTRFDREYAIQIGSMDPVFHDASRDVQPLPFANMKDTQPMLNGRGYPDTVAPSDDTSQWLSSRIDGNVGEKILVRLSNLNVTRFYTLSVLGIPMKVIGNGSKKLGPMNDTNNYYTTNSVRLGGGESMDVLLDTAGIPAGTYFMYTTNLNYLSNNGEDYGGMMTEIVLVQ